MPSVFSRTEGDNISPPLVWSGAPTSTQSLALIVDDPDAPDPANPQTTAWVHWVLYNVIPQSNQEQPQTLAQGDTSTGTVALNDWKQRQYDGPDPPIGSHRYFFRLYALDTILEEAGIVDKQSLLAAAEGHVLAATDLIGRYQKSV